MTKNKKKSHADAHADIIIMCPDQTCSVGAGVHVFMQPAQHVPFMWV